MIELSSLDGTDGFVLNGVDGGDRSGQSLSYAGDINGDGFADFLVGADRAGSGGAAYLVFGAASSSAALELSSLSGGDGTSGFQLTGNSTFDFAGSSVSGVGDFNGDGYDDFLVGARLGDSGGNASGTSYLVFGKASGFSGNLDLSSLGAGDGSEGFELRGVDAVDYSGSSVAAGGDINGDGYDDLLIGAPGGDAGGADSGEAYVVFGRSAGITSTLELSSLSAGDGSEGFVLEGIDAGDGSGFTLDRAGDVNGDGYGDVLVGARFGDASGSDSGESYVVFGKSGGFSATLDLSTLSGGSGTDGFQLSGGSAGEWAGTSVSTAGDLNGDGYDDLVVSASRSHSGGDGFGGVTYVVFGKSDSFAGEVELSSLAGGDGSEAFRIDGASSSDFSGTSASSAGDVNGDGYDDLLVGAPFGDASAVNAGEAYVLYGKGGGFSSVFELSTLSGGGGAEGFQINGGAANDLAGSEVQAAGDVNGDGYDDLLVGAPGADTNGSDAGNSYVVYGGDFRGEKSGSGTAGADILVGTTGNDLLQGLGGADAIEGGRGNDLIQVADVGFRHVDGGSLTDTLEFTNSGGISLDLTDAGVRGRLQSIEIIDLGGGGTSNSLNLRAADIVAVTGSDPVVGGTTLRVRGLTGDSVTSPESWLYRGTSEIQSVTYHIYQQDGVTLAIETTVNATGVGTANQAPTDLDLSGTEVADDAAVGTVIGSLSTSDPDAFDSHTYTIQSGDTGKFEIVGDELRVKAGAELDRTVAGTHDLTIRSTDFGGLTRDEVFTIQVKSSGTFQLSDLSGGDGSTGTEIRGAASGDKAGFSLGRAGDVDGDGFEDFLVGASQADGSGTDTGKAYLVFGKSAGLGATFELSSLSGGGGTNGVELRGVDAFDRAGAAVDGVGDFNGDGYDDLVVGALGGDAGGSSSGEAYVVYGKSSGFSGSFELSSLSAGGGGDGFVLRGGDLRDYAGVSVSAAGDVNGDGYADLVVGARGDGSSPGGSYVVFGTSQTLAGGVELSALSAGDGSTGFQLGGIDNGDQAGFSVSGIGDFNQDGYDDLVVGARFGDARGSNSGESYVVFGKSGGFGANLELSTLSVGSGTDGFQLNGVGSGDWSGISVAGAGDFNGDGLDDVIVGASRSSPDGEGFAGEAYVVYGRSSGITGSFELSGLSGGDGSQGFQIDGADSIDFAAESVSSAGDVNGDGYDDLIIGARLGEEADLSMGPGLENTGEAYVIFGRSDGIGGNFDLSSLSTGVGDDGFQLTGVTSDDFAGSAVRAAGDVDGDGYDDLLVGAPGADTNGSSAGDAYLFLGRNFRGEADSAGTAGADILVGTSGANVLSGSGGADSIRGGAGDDEIQVPDATFFRLDGGGGDDRLHWNNAGGGLDIDLTEVANQARISGIEEIYLGASGTGNSLTIDARAVHEISGSNVLRIRGGGGDMVTREGVWAEAGTTNINGTDYDVYTSGGVTLQVQQGLDSSVTRQIQLTSLSSGGGAEGFRIDGVDQNDLAGFSVAGIGDVNGDGYADLLLGAPGGEASDPQYGSSNRGEAYVLFGKSSSFGGVFELSTLSGGGGSGGFRIDGVDAGDFLGRSVGGGGDVNGDGYADLVVGSRDADPNGADSGESYVLFGKSASFGGVVELSTLSGGGGSAGFQLNGAASGEYSGASVSSAGDFDGDGYQDLVVGGWSTPARSYVVFGKSGGFSGSFELSTLSGGDGSQGFQLQGTSTGNRPISVASAGDVNGDGLDDLVVGSGNTLHGESYVVFGRSDGSLTNFGLQNLSGGDGSDGFMIRGASIFERSGNAVHSAGDVNGDGYADLLIGAYAADTNDDNAGAAYVVFGKSGGFSPTLELSTLSGGDGSTGFALYGDGSNRSLGHSVSSAGDVDGDGYDDLLVGTDQGLGEAYLVYGRSGGFAASYQLSSLSSGDGSVGIQLATGVPGANTGGSLSAAGDVDGDGFADILVGSHGGDFNVYGDSGGAYVVFGDDFRGQVDTSASASADVLVGTAGNDSVNGLGGADAISTGAGDDTIQVPDVGFFRLDGGGGTDTLAFTNPGGGLTLDLSVAASQGKLSGIEIIDLGASGAGNDLTVRAVDVARIADGNVLRIDGGAADSVTSTGTWTVAGTTTHGADTYDVLTQGAATLEVQQGVDITGITQANQAPTDLALSSSSVAENSPAGTVVATLTTTDPNPGDTHSYSIVAGDTTNFEIVGDELRVKAGASIDFESATSHDLTIRSTDAGGQIHQEAVTLTVRDVTEVFELSTLAGGDGSRGTRFDGIDVLDASGGSVSGGDVDGDGYADLFLGAFQGEPNGDSSGEGYVLFGGSAGFAGNYELSALSGSGAGAGFQLNGVDVGDKGGRGSVVGDVNGDGLADLLVSAPLADPNGNASGESYLVYGRSSGFGTTLELSSLSGGDGSAGFQLNGTQASELMGATSSRPGDLDGDGLADMVVGGYDGKAYVVFGRSAASGPLLEFSGLSGGDGSLGFQLQGRPGERTAERVGFAGDVNGDGFDDLLVSAHEASPNGDYSGATYLLLGRSGGFGANFQLSGLTTGDGSLGTQFNGVSEYDGYDGLSLSGAGDFNGDGLGDLVIGAQAAGNYQGRTYVVFGSTSGFGGTFELSTLSGGNGSAGFQIDGNPLSDDNAQVVSGAGDVDGDGYDDLLVSAPEASPNGSQSGATYLVFGNSGGFGGHLELTSLEGGNGLQGFQIRGEATGDAAGRAIAGAGDVNGDGFDDLLVGASAADVSGSGSGASYLVLGRDFRALGDATATSDADILTGTASGETLAGLGGADVVNAGAGDDTIQVPDVDFFRLDGGSGTDTLELTGSGQVLDLTSASSRGRLENIEVVDLGSSGSGNDLVLDETAVRAVADGVLRVRGGSADVVGASGVWTQGSSTNLSGVDYDVFTQGAATLQVEQGIDVSGVATPGLSNFQVSTLAGGAGTTGFQVNGGGTQDFLGELVSGLGDVNGDGYDDLLIASIGASPSGRGDAGEAYVLFGKSSGFSSVFEATSLASGDGSEGFRIEGVDVGGLLGDGGHQGEVGDVNGDGFADILLSSYRAGSSKGRSYLVFGKSSGFGSSFDLSTLSGGDGSLGFRLESVNSEDQTGYSAVGAGDLDGDGYDDFVLGARYSNSAGSSTDGETYVVFGRSGGFPADFQLSTLSGGDGSSGFQVNAVDSDDSNGETVALSGDFNGDGYDDLVLGARLADAHGTYTGEAYVVFGKSGGFGSTFELSTLSGGGGSGGFQINGVDAGDVLGESLDFVGDVNGDGYEDLLLGASGADANGSSSGEAYVLYGSSSSSSGVVELSTLSGGGGSAGFQINGAEGSDGLGYEVSAAGDVNGDGLADLLLGSTWDNAAYVLFGSSSSGGVVEVSTLSGGDGSAGFQVTGKDSSDFLGANLSGAGDLNGDGFDDLVLGAMHADPHGNSSGEAYVLFGRDYTGVVDPFGTSGADQLVGSAGVDHLVGLGGVDSLRAGAGDDHLSVGDLTFRSVDGGGGDDTLAFSLGSGQTVDLRAISNARIQDVEHLDLGGEGHTLQLTAADVLDLSDSSNVVFVEGSAGSLEVFGSSWTQQADAGGYEVYTDDNSDAEVHVDPVLGVTFSS